jgi:hypothetical protein
MGPDKPPHKFSGTESVRALGGLWIIGEGRGQMPDGTPSISLLTLGYDPQKKRFVGTWVGSMMTTMWLYTGTRDTSGNVLTLETEGPDFAVEGRIAPYHDAYEFRGDDHRILTSATQGADGKWTKFMTAHYRRVK